MAAVWTDPNGGEIESGTAMTVAGDYILNGKGINRGAYFGFGAKGAEAGQGATIQLWGRIMGVKTNIGSATAVTFAAPVVWPSAYLICGEVGMTISALTGGVVVEVAQ